jgi:tRNA-splicing ligase RtcB
MVLRQVGTLGGGNHFLEVQYDESGEIWLMVHSGSRAIGLKVAEHYDRQARKLNDQWKSPHPPYLNWLPTDHETGQRYMADMQWAVDYALANRKEMLRSALGVLGIEFDEAQMTNIPHNYAALENHYGRNVIVHRKGATRARKGEIGIIPGSMGSSSFIVRGKGNAESYSSCSHGAGRAMGRKAAFRALNTEQFAEAIAHTFSTPAEGYLDEAPMAYKDIDAVMAQQTELVDIVHTLRPVITLKSGDGSVD